MLRGLRSLAASISSTPLAAAGLPLQGIHPRGLESRWRYPRCIRSAAACIGKVSGSCLYFCGIELSLGQGLNLQFLNFFSRFSALGYCPQGPAHAPYLVRTPRRKLFPHKELVFHLGCDCL
jgi:hypothetical protein